MNYLLKYFRNSFVKTALLLLFITQGEPFFLLSILILFLGCFCFIELNGKLIIALKVLLGIEIFLISVSILNNYIE